MTPFDLQQWIDKTTQGEVFATYKGAITADLISNILNLIENKLEGMNEDLKVKKKVFNVLVESLQNLYHHIDEPPAEEELDRNFAIFILSKADGRYKISTGNFVRHDRIKMLRDRMDQINYLSKDELKSLYKLILNNEEFSDKGGGGLGMIDIARKAGNKLNYNFYPYNEKYSFFSLDVIVSDF